MNAIKHHSRRNLCTCCAEDVTDEEGRCEARADAACECAFHSQASERLIERVRYTATITSYPTAVRHARSRQGCIKTGAHSMGCTKSETR